MTRNFNLVSKLLESFGTIHLIGIGGIGISGIAEILHNIGCKVQGSDQAENSNTARLRNQGIKIFIGHDETNVMGANVVVKSTAVKDDNPEIVYAKANKIPVIKRDEMLTELMRLKISISISGTHGKTTTTSLVSSMFEAAHLNPTVINGGIINTKGTNAYLGEGDYLVVEADESDGTFIKIPSAIVVVTNMDPEHLDYYGNFENYKKAFRSFVENIPFYGFAIMCIDHKEVETLYNTITNKQMISYGIQNENAQIRATNIRNNGRGSIFDVVIADDINYEHKLIKDVSLPVPGVHNVLNSLAAISIAVQLNFRMEYIQNGFNNFEGVKRRFTLVDVINDMRIVDDYAHHPEEVKVTLATAKTFRKEDNKVVAIFQPHRYSRVQNLMTEFAHSFNDADALILTEIYSAGETKIDGVDHNVMAQLVKKAGFKGDVFTASSQQQIYSLIDNIAKPNDIILFMGAGNITQYAYALPNHLKEKESLKTT